MTLSEAIFLVSGGRVVEYRRQERKSPPAKMVRTADDLGKTVLRVFPPAGGSFLVDLGMRNWISESAFYITPRRYVIWPIRVGKRTHGISLHRLIMLPKGREIVDHKNHNPLDNRRCNLRIASKAKNGQNKIKCGYRGRPASSKYKGVRWHRRNKIWNAHIVLPATRRQKHLGTFEKERDAAKAYDRAASKYFGEFALLNFP